MGPRPRFITGSLGNVGPTLPFPSLGLNLVYKKQVVSLRNSPWSLPAERLDGSLELLALQQPKLSRGPRWMGGWALGRTLHLSRWVALLGTETLR